MRQLLFFGVIVFAFSACGPNYIYEETLEMPQTGWEYKDSLQAQFHIDDTLVIYNLHLEIEHGITFPHQNFYTKIHTTFPEGQRTSQQVSLELMNKTGQWHGDCSSETCVLDILIQEGVFFSQSGNYKITIEQFSRLDPLPQIHNLTFRLEDTGERKDTSSPKDNGT